MAARQGWPAPGPRVPDFQLPGRWSADTCKVSRSPDHLAVPPVEDGVKPGFTDGDGTAFGTIRNWGLAGGAAWPSLRRWINSSIGMVLVCGLTVPVPVLSIPGWEIPRAGGRG